MAKKNVIQPVKGTRDFYPEVMSIRKWLYETAASVSEMFGYQEYEGPLIESIELYAAKSGDELVKEQSFVFEDRGSNLITLRPELTPTLARMVAQRQNQLIFPLRKIRSDLIDPFELTEPFHKIICCSKDIVHIKTLKPDFDRGTRRAGLKTCKSQRLYAGNWTDLFFPFYH